MCRLALVLLAVFVSTGVVVAVTGKDNEAEAGAAPYTQVVDNSDADRFKADEDWGESSYGLGVNGDDYRFARPSKKDASPAEFRVDIPDDGEYAVYARWPKVKGLSGAAPVEVDTGSGTKRARVNQQKNGGQWVRIGTYDMKAGDAFVRFSRKTNGESYVGADAVKVEQVSTKPSKKPAPSAAPSRPPNDSGASDSGDSAPSTKGEEAVEKAKEFSGVPYRLGGASRSGIDCSGLTKKIFEEFGVELPHSVTKQEDYGTEVPKGEEQPGDMVFFDEHGDGISHVGIYAGAGKVVHASNYFDEVVESEMEYLDGYVSARRVV